ncbi:general amino acid permease AGP2 protein [Rutstroemia sp. NJR-2017a WRK4]|nr:general amino acid permease AGP2 protein [Rutstroemia sp. NJR-2017a WRK4]
MSSSGFELPHSAGAEYIASDKHAGNGNALPRYEKHEEELLESPVASLGSPVLETTHDSTHRQLRPRHIQLIGIGGTIGTALFVSIGKGLINGGPGSLFLAFTIWYLQSSLYSPCLASTNYSIVLRSAKSSTPSIQISASIALTSARLFWLSQMLVVFHIHAEGLA